MACQTWSEIVSVWGVNALDMKEIIRVFQQSPAITQCCLDLGYEASNASERTREIKDWVHKTQFTNLLVTSNYHMPRAMLKLLSTPHWF